MRLHTIETIATGALLICTACASAAGASDGGTLAEGGACITTIEAVEARALSPQPGPACPSVFDNIVWRPSMATQTMFEIGTCEGTPTFVGTIGMDLFVCIYDPTTHALVGMATSTDYNAFCSMRSSCLAGGTLPPYVECGIYGLTVRCSLRALLRPDASANDAATVNGG